MLSVDGYTFSKPLTPVARDPAKRIEFARSSVQLLEDHGLDGIDIDWEFPEDATQAANFVLLLEDLRAALDQHAAKKGESKYLLSVAAPAGEQRISVLQVAAMDQWESFLRRCSAHWLTCSAFIRVTLQTWTSGTS